MRKPSALALYPRSIGIALGEEGSHSLAIFGAEFADPVCSRHSVRSGVELTNTTIRNVRLLRGGVNRVLSWNRPEGLSGAETTMGSIPE